MIEYELHVRIEFLGDRTAVEGQVSIKHPVPLRKNDIIFMGDVFEEVEIRKIVWYPDRKGADGLLNFAYAEAVIVRDESGQDDWEGPIDDMLEVWTWVSNR